MERCTPACVQMQTPSGWGLTLTLEGLCLRTVIATRQARYAASASVPASLCKCVFVRLMRDGNSRRHSVVTVTWVCLCVNNSGSSDKAQGNRTIAPFMAFVCGGGGDRK